MEEPTPSPSEPGSDLFDRWLAHRDPLAAPPQPRTPADDAPTPEPQPVRADPEPDPESAPAPTPAPGRRRSRRAGRFGRRRVETETMSAQPPIDVREFEAMVQAETAPLSLPPEVSISELDLPPLPEPPGPAVAAKPQPVAGGDAAFADVDVREFEELVLAESKAPAARLEAERDAEAAALAARLAEEARAGAVGSGRGVLAAFAAASATADAAAAPPAVPVDDLPERLSWSTRSPLLRRTRRRTPAEPAATAPASAAPLDAAHEVLAAFAAGQPTSSLKPAPAPAAASEPAPRVRLVSDEPPPARAPAPAPEPAPAPRPAAPRNVTFRPRRGARRVVGLLLLAALAATAYAGYLAYEAQTTTSIGVAAGLGLFTLVLWAIYAGSSVSHLSVTNGQLEVRNNAGRFVFDLASPYMPIEVIGTPGSRKWKVLFVRRSMAPFTIDSSMVDPQEFMTVLRHYRPEHDAS